MTEMSMRKVRAGSVGRDSMVLAPTTQIAEDDLALVSANKEVLVVARVPRNMRAHNLMWALAQKVSEACDWLHDKNDAMDTMLVMCRHVRRIYNPRTEQLTIVPKSIAVSALPGPEFERVFNRFIYVVVSEIVPGISEQALRDEIMEMVGRETNDSERRAA